MTVEDVVVMKDFFQLLYFHQFFEDVAHKFGKIFFSLNMKPQVASRLLWKQIVLTPGCRKIAEKSKRLRGVGVLWIVTMKLVGLNVGNSIDDKAV